MKKNIFFCCSIYQRCWCRIKKIIFRLSSLLWKSIYLFIYMYFNPPGDCDKLCLSCSGSLCSLCIDGYYPFGTECRRCSNTGCKTCSVFGSCETCTSGLWGRTCNDACAGGCGGSVCNKIDGSCTCKPGYTGTFCSQECFTQCVDDECSATNWSCKCIKGYYGDRCEQKCYFACKDCTDNTQCTACPAGKYKTWCLQTCHCNGGQCNIKTGQCDKQATCPSHCTTCSDSGVCTACPIDFYGPQCSQLCHSGCSGGCDINTGVCYSCDPGYFGPNCDMECAKTCSGCHQNGTCMQCSNSNMYGIECTTLCNSLCIDNMCDRWTGKCPKKCNSRCKTCNNSTGNCIKCKQTSRYGNTCQYMCSTGCANQTCNISSGDCHACIDGHFGPFCNLTCSLTCKNNQCSRNGNCMSGCKDNYYGSKCSVECSDNCKPVTPGGKCDETGKCLHGCVNGFTGDDCNTGKNVHIFPLKYHPFTSNRLFLRLAIKNVAQFYERLFFIICKIIMPGLCFKMCAFVVKRY